MISRIVRYIFIIASIAICFAVIAGRGGYASLLPDSYNPLEMIKGAIKGEEPQPLELEEPAVMVSPLDSLDVMQLDSLQMDSLQHDTL